MANYNSTILRAGMLFALIEVTTGGIGLDSQAHLQRAHLVQAVKLQLSNLPKLPATTEQTKLEGEAKKTIEDEVQLKDEISVCSMYASKTKLKPLNDYFQALDSSSDHCINKIETAIQVLGEDQKVYLSWQYSVEEIKLKLESLLDGPVVQQGFPVGIAIQEIVDGERLVAPPVERPEVARGIVL